MKLATLLLAMPFLFGSAIHAQDLSLVEPGDILVVKIITPDGKPISKVEAVTQESTLQSPHLLAMASSGRVTVGGLSMAEATRRLTQSYSHAAVMKGNRDQISISEILVKDSITIERGTFSQLFEQ
jgi:hypothetical protein